MPGALIGIDVGTSATKALAIDADTGRVLASASRSYPLDAPRPSWSQQNPEDWWIASRDAIAEIVRALGDTPVLALSLSGQMHGSVLLDRAALEARGQRPIDLTPAILWNDQRTSAECARIEREAGGRRALVELVGNAALPGFTLPKLLWIREHAPRVWDECSMVLLPKDSVRFRLSGEVATDVGDASGTLVFDIDRREWSRDMLDRFAIAPELLPPALESCAVAGRISRWAAEQTGLREGIPVFAGSGDNMAGAAGAGVVRDGLVLATLGTSGVIYAHTERPRRDLDLTAPGRLHAMCAADGTPRTPGNWCITGCTLSAAGCLQWAHDALFPDASYADLLREAASVPAGAGGLVFLPHLTGERCPYPDPSARGAWIGLTSRHTRGHLVRAILEGVTATMARILDLAESIGVRPERVRLGGGGARSPLWRQMQADLYARPVEMTESEEGPAFGAALMAGVGAGVWGSLCEACDATIRVVETREPEDADRSREIRAVYAGMFERIAPTFAALGSLDRAQDDGARATRTGESPCP